MTRPHLVLLLAAGLCFPFQWSPAADGPPDLLIGFTQRRNDLPSGQFDNWCTARASVVRADGTGDRPVAATLAMKPHSWTQFAGWSPDGRQAIVLSCWESPENAAWERAHKTFRLTQGHLTDCCLVDLATGAVTNLTAIDRLSDYNTGLFILPDGSGYGFLATIDGNQRPYQMDRDGRSKRPATKQGAGFAYGYSASPDGKLICYHENYQIVVSAADGSNWRKIETGKPFNFSPRWSPDGEWLMFVSGEHYNCHPYVVRRDGTGLKKIADRGGYRGVVETLVHPAHHSESSDLPVWGGDSRSIFHTAKVGGRIELMRATLDGTVKQLTHSKPCVRHYHPAVSPDGDWILFSSDSTGRMQIQVARADGSDEKPVTAAPPGWSAMHGHWQPVAARK
jgi:TolB protein